MNKSGTDIEYEAKFYPVNKEEYRNKLQKMGAKLVIPERKMIRTVADHRGNPTLVNTGYIRVRDEGNLIRLSLKMMPNEGGKLTDQKEIEVEVSDFDDTVRIFEATGIKFNRKQETLREEWEYKNSQITLDSWPGLETFSEIESDSEEKVKEIAEDLGFDWDKKIITPAPEIYAKVYDKDINEILGMVSNITFENNPFKGMKKVWPEKEV